MNKSRYVSLPILSPSLILRREELQFKAVKLRIVLQDAVGKVSASAKIHKMLAVLEAWMNLDLSWGRTDRAIVLDVCSSFDWMQVSGPKTSQCTHSEPFVIQNWWHCPVTKVLLLHHKSTESCQHIESPH